MKRLMGRPWPKGVSGNPKGRPPLVLAVAEMARTEVQKHRLVEKLGEIAANPGRGRNAVDHQLRAIQLLLAYAYGPPRGEIEGLASDGLRIEVVYVDRRAVVLASSEQALVPAEGTV